MKRYFPYDHMVEHDEGEYVSLDELRALQAKYDELAAKLDKAETAVANMFHRNEYIHAKYDELANAACELLIWLADDPRDVNRQDALDQIRDVLKKHAEGK